MNTIERSAVRRISDLVDVLLVDGAYRFVRQITGDLHARGADPEDDRELR